MDQQNNVRIDVVGSADGFKPASQEATQELDRLKSTAQSAGQELGNLARGALSEATSGMGELGVVAERAVLSAAGLGAGFLAATVGLAAYAAAAREGREEQLAMEHALTMTGNAAGLTRDQMIQLAHGVEQATTLTIKQSKDLVTEIVSSGKIAGEAVGSIAALADNYANATGTKLDAMAPKLVSLFEDPAKGAAKLNETMHFLTNTQLDYIKALVDTGREGEAQIELANRLGEVLPKHAGELNDLGRAWVELRKYASSAWDAMLNVGREDTLQQKLDQAKEAAANSSAWWRQFRDFDGKIAVYQAAVDKQNADASAAKQAADDQAREAKANALIERLTKSGQKNAIAAKMRDAAALLPAGAELDEILSGYRDQIIKIDAEKKTKAKKPDDSEFKERLRQLRDEAKAEADLINQRQKADALLASYERQDALTVQRIDRSAQLAAMSERERVVAETVYAAQDKSAQRQEQIIKQIADETERTRALNEEKLQLARQIDAVTAAAEKSYDAQRTFEYGWNRALQNYVDQSTNAAAQAQGAFQTMTSVVEDSLVSFATNTKYTFKDMAQSILRYLAQVAAKQASMGLMQLGSSLASAYFSSGSSTASAGPSAAAGGGTWMGNTSSYSLNAMGNHTGGIAGSEATFMRSVPAGLFSGALRYHTGGIAGDEVPTILRKGEGVFTEGQMKALGSLGGVSIQQIFTIGDGGSSSEQTSGDASMSVRQFADMIAGTVRRIIVDEMRSGGLLEKARSV